MTAMRNTLAIVLFTSLLGGCGLPGRPATPAPPPAGEWSMSGVPVDADYSGTGGGTVKSAVTLPTVDRRILKVTSLAARMEFESRSGIDGTPQVVSGAVFVPKGDPPSGGWPILAMGHGTTGIQHDCGPSRWPNLLGASEPVATLVNDGFVVALPDYQGLGIDEGYHPYLDSSTVGFNMIDAVRAARKVVPTASDRWLAFGSSQGGQAAWAANELAGTYGAGLKLVGSVSVAPAANITGLADAAAAGTLTPDQGSALQWVLVALKNEHPELDLDDYRRGVVAEDWDILSACAGPLVSQRDNIVKQVTPDDLRPSSEDAVNRLRGYLNQMSLPKTAATAPMLVVFGDMDKVVAPEWTADAVRRGCDMGDVIEAYSVPGRGHDDIDGSVALGWIMQRFSGADARNSCDVPSGPILQLSPKPWYLQ